MLERKEHKKMYKSGKNQAVVKLSTAALVFGATTINASSDINIENNDSSTVQVTTGNNDIAVFLKQVLVQKIIKARTKFITG